MSTSLTSAPVPAPVLDVEPGGTCPQEEEARVKAEAGGGGDSDSAEP